MNHRNIGKWFHILERRSQMYIAKSCEAIGISAQAYYLLLNLYGHEGVSQEDMAGIMLVDKAVVAREIKILEEKGLVERVQDKADKRIKRLYATEAGKAREGFLLEILQRWIDYLSGGMDERTKATVLDGMKYLSEKAVNADFERI